MACSGIAVAQERSAVSNIEVQTSWSALQMQIETVSTTLSGVSSLVSQEIVCGKLGKVYAPGQAGADAQGCLVTMTAPSVTTDITNIKNTLNSTNSTLNSVYSSLNSTNSTLSSNVSNVDNILNCNRSGLVFNGASCITPASTATNTTVKANCSIQMTSGPTNRNGLSTSCPGGYSYTGSTGGSDYGTPMCARVVCN